MTKEERQTIIDFAKGQAALRKEATRIFLKYLGLPLAYKDTPEMLFMSEVVNPCPDLALRATYRKELVNAKT